MFNPQGIINILGIYCISILKNMWKDLNIEQRSELIKLGVQNGIKDLGAIKRLYNQQADGGFSEWKHRLKAHNNIDVDNDNSHNYVEYFNNNPEEAWSLVTHEGNKYGKGGYKSSQSIRDRIAKWEGTSMKTNRAFELEDIDFYNAIPSDIRGKMTQDELDALYSYSYNVGAGNFKKRVVPQLVNLYNGNGNVENVQNSMWASRDKELRGLAKRRNVEKQLFANAYNKSKGQSVIEPSLPPITNPESIITPLQETSIDNPQYSSVANWQSMPLPTINKEPSLPDREDIDLGLEYSFTPSRLVVPEVILPKFS